MNVHVSYENSYFEGVTCQGHPLRSKVKWTLPLNLDMNLIFQHAYAGQYIGQLATTFEQAFTLSIWVGRGIGSV